MRSFLLLSAVAFLSCSGVPGVDGGMGGGGGGSTGGGTGSTVITGAANAIAVQGDKLLVAGSIATRDDEFQLVRMHADGGLDTTFADGGYAHLGWPTYTWVDPLLADAGIEIEMNTDLAYAVELQGTKILIGGTVSSQGGQTGAFGLARYSADGVLDTTFGVGGKADVRFGSLIGGTAVAMAQRGDGKIYLAGYASRASGTTNNADFGVARFSADGVLDTTFGAGGSVQQDFGKNEFARRVAFQGNKVLLGGGDDFSVTRLNDDGSLDTAFGTAGLASSVGGFGHSMRVLAGGQILVAGSQRRAGSDQPWDIKLVRYSADGVRDATFGTDGVVMLAFDEHQVSVLSLDELSDGKLVLSMTAGFGTTRGFYGTVTRLSASGAVDTTFGTAGLTELIDGLALLGGVVPASPNHAVVSGGRLHFVDTNTFGRTQVIYGSTGL